MDETSIVLAELLGELSKSDRADVGTLELKGASLSALDGNVNLSANVRTDAAAHPSIAHCHIVARLGTETSGKLDACVIGIDADRKAALKAAAAGWVEIVAGPIFSMAHARPVMGAEHFDGTDVTGVTGSHGFVGPMRSRMVDGTFDFDSLAEVAVFDYAAEMAPPGLVHLAKVTLNAGANGWNRSIEVDGHAACHSDPSWDALPISRSQGIVTQFAVFHYADQPDAIAKRQQVDDAIWQYVSAFARTADTWKAAELLASEGIDKELVHRIYTLSPLAFGRVVLHGIGVDYSPYYTRIKSDGSLQKQLHLMREPVFARSMALSQAIMSGELLEAFKELATTSAEFDAINNALHAGSNPKDLKLSPSLIPDHDTSNQAVAQAVEQLQNQSKKAAPTSLRRRWWRFW
jgi:hypothetical protein